MSLKATNIIAYGETIGFDNYNFPTLKASNNENLVLLLVFNERLNQFNQPSVSR
ncbi:hypothetical protein BH10ACI1_BH10ACI1_07980 [soil metagenome]